MKCVIVLLLLSNCHCCLKSLVINTFTINDRLVNNSIVYWDNVVIIVNCVIVQSRTLNNHGAGLAKNNTLKKLISRNQYSVIQCSKYGYIVIRCNYAYSIRQGLRLGSVYLMLIGHHCYYQHPVDTLTLHYCQQKYNCELHIWIIGVYFT